MPSAKQLNAFLRRWDTGTRASRTKQLEEFVARCADMTGPQLEDELENGASLVLTRISAWLRLSYALGHSVALQLQAIAVFVAASSGQRYLAEFVEVGGVATVVEILSLPQLPEHDKREAMRLLMAVANAGRHYKEIVCDGDGIEAIEDFMRASKSEALLEDARDLLVTIGRGNPRFSTEVHRALLRLLRIESAHAQRLACAGLRTLLKVLPTSQLYRKDEEGHPQPVLHEGYCEAAVGLLNSFNLQLLYEAGQLFSVLRHLIHVLIDATDPKRAPPLHMQASAARALGQLVASLPTEHRERACLELELVPWLCTLLSRETFSPECQKAAVQALQLLGLTGSADAEMKRLLGPQAFSIVMNAHDAVQAALSLNADMLRTLQPQMDAFIAVHRRHLKPEPLHLPEAMSTLLESAPAEVVHGEVSEVSADEAAVTGGDTGAQPKLA